MPEQVAKIGRIPAGVVALAMLCVYLFSYAGVPHAMDELSALSAAETLLAGDGTHVNQMEWDQARTPPQNSFGTDGRLYSKKGIGITLAALPLLALGKLWPQTGAVQTTLLLGALVGACTVYAFYHVGRNLEFTPGVAVIGALAVGLGTALWPYSRTLFSEGPAALGLAVALAGAVTARRRPNTGAGPLLLVGLGLAILTLAKSSNAVLAPVFAVYLAYGLLWEQRRSLAFGRLLRQTAAALIPFGAAVGIVIAYNYLRFGTLLTFPLEPYEAFTAELRVGVIGLLFSPGKGLFWYTPLAWLILAGASRWPRKRRLADMLLAVAVIAAPLLLYAKWFDWPGGRAWGPRMIVFTLPAVVMLTLPALDRLAERDSPRWLRAATVFLLAASVIVQLPGVLVNFEVREGLDMQGGLAFSQLIWEARHTPLLTYWGAMVPSTFDPIWLQPYFWRQSVIVLIVFWVTCIGCMFLVGRAVSTALRGRPAARRNALAATAAALFAVAIVIAASPDPRWHERSADPDDNRAVLAFVDEQSAPGDVQLLDMLVGNDLEGRQWVWMNDGPSRPQMIGWIRKEAMAPTYEAQLGGWLAPYARAWLILTDTDEGDAGSTTEQWLDGWAYRGRQQWIGGQRLVEYLLPDPAAPAGAPAGESVDFGGKIGLEAFDLQAPNNPNQALIRLVWDRQAESSLRFSVQALDTTGQLIAQIDRAPDQSPAYENRVGLVTETAPQRIILKVYDANSGEVFAAASGDSSHAEYLDLTEVLRRRTNP